MSNGDLKALTYKNIWRTIDNQRFLTKDQYHIGQLLGLKLEVYFLKYKKFYTISLKTEPQLGKHEMIDTFLQ